MTFSLTILINYVTMKGDVLNYFLSLGSTKISELVILSLGTRTLINTWSWLGTYFEFSEYALCLKNIWCWVRNRRGSKNIRKSERSRARREKRTSFIYPCERIFAQRLFVFPKASFATLSWESYTFVLNTMKNYYIFFHYSNKL